MDQTRFLIGLSSLSRVLNSHPDMPAPRLLTPLQIDLVPLPPGKQRSLLAGIAEVMSLTSMVVNEQHGIFRMAGHFAGIDVLVRAKSDAVCLCDHVAAPPVNRYTYQGVPVDLLAS